MPKRKTKSGRKTKKRAAKKTRATSARKTRKKTARAKHRKRNGPLERPMGPPPEAEPVFDLHHLKKLITERPRRKKKKR